MWAAVGSQLNGHPRMAVFVSGIGGQTTKLFQRGQLSYFDVQNGP
jgi:hypothetical protein